MSDYPFGFAMTGLVLAILAGAEYEGMLASATLAGLTDVGLAVFSFLAFAVAAIWYGHEHQRSGRRGGFD